MLPFRSSKEQKKEDVNFGTGEVQGALEHLLRFVLTLTVADPTFAELRKQTEAIRSDLDKLLALEDLKRVGKEIRTLKLPVNLSSGISGSSPGFFLSECIKACEPLARGLALSGIVPALQQIRAELEQGKDPTPTLPRVRTELGKMTETAEWLFEFCASLRMTLQDVVHVLSPLAERAPSSLQRLQSVRQRLQETQDIEEVERLRKALLDETSHLIQEVSAQHTAIKGAWLPVQSTLEKTQAWDNPEARAEWIGTLNPVTYLGTEAAMRKTIQAQAKHASNVGVVMLHAEPVSHNEQNRAHATRDVNRWLADRIRTHFKSEPSFHTKDHFVILLPQGTLEKTREVAAFLCRQAEGIILEIRGENVRVTISAGVSLWKSGEPFSAAATRVIHALEAAKERRGSVQAK